MRSWSVPRHGQRFNALWRKLASDNGLPGLHLVGFTLNRNWDCRADGFDAAADHYLPPPLHAFQKRNPSLPTIYRYADVSQQFVSVGTASRPRIYPCVVPNWDNTPRSGANGLVLHESSPELFRAQLRQALSLARARPPGERLVFVKAWNEWAEGNHLEPDLRHGHGYLQVIKEELDACHGGN